MTPMTMKDWIEALDGQIVSHKRKLLEDKGTVSHEEAVRKAEQEFSIYRQREMRLLESDFEKAVKQLSIVQTASAQSENVCDTVAHIDVESPDRPCNY